MHESGQIGQLPVPDPDRSSRPLDKLWGWGGGGRSPKNIFSALRVSFWSENRGGGDPGPLPWIRHRLRNTEISTD